VQDKHEILEDEERCALTEFFPQSQITSLHEIRRYSRAVS
jgi:hypothetical protein